MAGRWHPPDERSYSHLLSLYLGDGHLARFPRTYRLVITCDASYPALVEEAWVSAVLTGLPRRTRLMSDPHSRCVRVVGDSKRWPEAFPQHGPGRKRARTIELAPWQREVVDRFPREFLRGLLHSDGCRTINRFKTRLPSGRVAEYAYPRWFFSNRSADIRTRSASTATCSASGGRSRTRGTSRSRTARASRWSTRSSRRSPGGSGNLRNRSCWA